VARKRRQPSLVTKTMTLAMDAASTVAARTRMMSAPELQGTAELAAEMRRMTQEKFEAAWLGLFEAQSAWMKLVLRSATGGIAGPAALANGLNSVAEAAMRPARKTAHANAIRLAARSPRR
jgi:hypothetical protein